MKDNHELCINFTISSSLKLHRRKTQNDQRQRRSLCEWQPGLAIADHCPNPVIKAKGHAAGPHLVQDTVSVICPFPPSLASAWPRQPFSCYMAVMSPGCNVSREQPLGCQPRPTAHTPGSLGGTHQLCYSSLPTLCPMLHILYSETSNLLLSQSPCS